MNFLIYINAFIVAQLFLFGILFFFRKSTNRKADRVLGVLAIISGFILLPGVLTFMGVLSSYPIFINFDHYFGFALPPTIYIYSKIVIDGKISNWRLRVLHYIPAIFSTIYFLQIHFQSEKEVLLYIDSLNQSVNSSEGHIAIGIYFLHSLVYLFMGCLVIYNHHKKTKKKLEKIETFHLRWIVVLYIHLFLVNVLLLYLTLTGNTPSKYSILVFFTSLIYYYPIVLIVKYPMQFHIYFPGVKQLLEKYKKSTFSNQKLDEKHQELIDYLSSKKPYKDPDLNREKLADQLNITSHHLSQIISSGPFVSFYDLINHSRIQESISLLSDKKHENLSIEGIGKMAGFKSKSTFFTAFKKETGHTPKGYIEKLNI